MKKIYLVFAMFGCLPFAATSQTILNETFETASTETYSPNLPAGWTTVDSYLGNVDKYRWHVYYASKGTITGTHVASCDAPMFTSDTEGVGPREEVLLSPELNLDNTYQLSFNWKAASASALEKQEYDFQVRVVEGDDLQGAKTLWSFQDADMLKESGIVNFPWTGWQVYNSQIDLSAYKGKKVKVAFVYKMLKNIANTVFLDDVIVKQFTPATTPKPVLSKRIYSFGNVYLGSKVYSDVITLKNEGANGLKINSIELPNGVSTTLDYSKVNLAKNESVDFQLAYTASMTSAADGNVVLKTNGGDVSLRVAATKQMLPGDATFEGFEKGVPPAGWTSVDWKSVDYALEGDKSAYASASFSGACLLTTPRLDMSTGAQSVSFSAFEQFESVTEGAVPGNDVTLEFSKDGGNSWTTVWTSEKLNEIVQVTVDLGTPASDNCYLRWNYSEIALSEEDYPEISIFYLDAVILPKLYGVGGVPATAALVSPANKATDIYNKDVLLEWNQALFADGYRLYVGTDAEATDLIDGQDMGTATSFVIPSCAYATTYNWKVVPYNEKGNAADAETWSFTTIADQTVRNFPWSENFEGDAFPPLGWMVKKDGHTRWDINSISPFEGKYSVSAGCYGAEEESSLVTPDFVLPSEPLQISFYWGNNVAVALEKDPSGLGENKTTADDGIDACYFEVFADGAWKQLAIISDKTNKYWVRENVDLSAYAGKTVSFRWRYVGHDYANATGVSLDMVSVSGVSDQKVAFNVLEWNAGSVNYGKSFTSTEALSLVNEGKTALKVSSVSFKTPNFKSTIETGAVIEPNKGLAFKLTFDALDSNALVEDEMTVAFENGYQATLPVKGNALGSDTRYYNFEDEEAGNVNPMGFTTIDVDRKPTTMMTGMNYPQYGVPFAFCVQDDKDWNNQFEPVSGTKVLVAIAPYDDSDSDDWIVSQRMTATADSKFRFYARNWNSVNSILPESQHNVEVLVSTTSATDRTSFETVMPKTMMPYYNNKSYEEYTVDLSKYAGQDVYIALRHTVTAGLAAFFDDFYFEHFAEFGAVESLHGGNQGVAIYPNPVVSALKVKGVDEAEVVVTNLSGAVVKHVFGVNEVNVSDLVSGVYLVTVKSEQGVYTTRVVKK